MEIEQVKTIEDAKECDRLLTKLIQSERQYHQNINKNYEAKGYFENLYLKKYNVLYVMKSNSKVIAYIYARITTNEDGPFLEHEALIDGLYVDEEYRHQKVATKLIEKVKEWCREKNVKYLSLNVIEKNEKAKSLYTHLDFQIDELKMTVKL